MIDDGRGLGGLRSTDRRHALECFAHGIVIATACAERKEKHATIIHGCRPATDRIGRERQFHLDSRSGMLTSKIASFATSAVVMEK
ncbi:MAG: hypothetical protein JWL59_4375 [Chthoniobacteraceae bacterium]|nr:hypothetical protein [Chthoniobacteraceae bacterium]